MADKTTRGTSSGIPEQRSYPAKFEVRSLPGGSNVELTGYASTVEQPYTMFDMFGDYSEVVRAGAFAKTLSEGADVSFLANHGGLTMSRTKTGTLRLSEDTTGLLCVSTMNSARGDVRDLLTAIEDGNVDEMSFAFRVMRQQWSPDYDERALMELNLDRGDVSAVNYGANPNTSIGVQRAFRSLRPAKLHRMAEEVRAGKTLSGATMTTLSQVLDLIASADDAVDAAQPLLADLMGVPNPDADDMGANEADEAAERARAFVDTLRRAHEADMESAR
jgi:HK97 family phage prohead protease